LIRKIGSIAKSIKSWIGIVGSIIAIMGLITFSLFILEEAFQTVMFGTWPAQDAKEWQLVKRGLDTMEKINETMKTMNKWFGWIQPFAWFAYDAYGTAADFYVKGLRAKTFAHCPECFDGEEVEFTFTATEMDVPEGAKWVWKVHTLRVLTTEVLEGGETYVVRGLLENGRVHVQTINRRSGDAKPKQDPGPGHQRRQESGAALH